MKNCDTARNALNCAHRYMALHSPGESWSFSEEGQYAFIERHEHFHGISHAKQCMLKMTNCLC